MRRMTTDLSPRELEVLGLLARGIDPASMSRRLHLSRDTIKSHLHRARVKLGAVGEPSTGLVAAALRAGVLDYDEGTRELVLALPARH